MQNLSAVMTKLAETNPGVLQMIYREPAITAYNRLEPRTRTENFERSLRAEIRDALWMLTRQWQMGELEAEDAGSAIDARLMMDRKHIDRLSFTQGPVMPYDDSIPVETLVEAETVPFTYALKIQAGQYFLRLHPAALRTKYGPGYISRFPIEQDAVYQDHFRNQTDGHNLYESTKDRVFDGEKIWKAILDGSFKTTAAVDPGDSVAMDTVTGKFRDWFGALYYQPADVAARAWHADQLDYQFSLATPPDASGVQTVLQAREYYQGRLDWYAFDDDLKPAPLDLPRPVAPPAGGPAVSPPGPPAPDEEVISFVPNSTSFKGMPNPRFWTMEDYQVNFGTLNAKTTDQLLLVFAEFGLIFGNDWFIVPYKLSVNTLCEIKGLVITDVFGDRTLIQAADAGADSKWQRWSMYNLSNTDHIGQYNKQFFLPSTLIQNQESDPIEKVNFIRDDMASMVWGIEDIVPDQTNRGIDGNLAADTAGVQPLPVDPDSPALIRYIFGTTVPENWIPFLPIHKPGSVQDIRLQRGAMPKLGVPPKDTIKAKGILLTEVPSPYYINEEEIPYAGTIVTRSFQRTRWYDGKTHVWIGRYRETGRGPGSSDLRFDQIEPVKK